VLMVTSSVRMVHRIHGNSSNSGPALPLGLECPVGSSGLEHGLVDSASSGNESNHGSAIRLQVLLDSRGISDSSLVLIGVVRDDGSVVSRASSDRTSVGSLGLDIADDGSFGEKSDGEDVTNGKSGLSSRVDELSSVQSLGGNEEFLVNLVFVGVSEVNLSQRSTTTGIVDDVLHHSSDVSVSLGIIETSESRMSLSVMGVGLGKQVR